MEQIDCLMVSKPAPGRLAFLERSVGSFLSQTHESRSLIVVLNNGKPDDTDQAVALLERYRDRRIQVKILKEPVVLGQARNAAIRISKGDYFCQWDDDDYSHPTRLERQLQAARESNADIVGLEEVLHYMMEDSVIKICNWKRVPYRIHPGTILVRRSSTLRYLETGPASKGGEDSNYLKRMLFQGRTRHELSAEPWLYVYIHHGMNFCEKRHHQELLRFARLCSPEEHQEVARRLKEFAFLGEPALSRLLNTW